MNEKEKRAREMFSKLKENIGKKVYITYWNYGRLFSDVEILERVVDFERIGTSSRSLPFVGYGCAIVSILDEDGKVLYSQALELYQPYDIRNSLGIVNMKERLFGPEIGEIERERYRETERYRLEMQKKDLEEIKKFQETEEQELIERTLPYVVDDHKEKFKIMVRNNRDSVYGILVLRMVSDLLIAIGQGMDFEEAIRTIADEKHNTSGYAMGVAANCIAHCSPRGEEFRKYWNGLHGISEDEKGVVNPAILIVSKK